MKFLVKESNHENDHREPVNIEVDSLSQAKRLASVKQLSKGTVLTIETEGGTRLSVKKYGKWVDTTDGREWAETERRNK